MAPSTRIYSPCSKASAATIWAFSCSKLCWAHLSASLIHRMGSYLFPHPIPLVAGLLAAGYWPFVFYNGQLLATTLVILVGLGLAVLLLHYAP